MRTAPLRPGHAVGLMPPMHPLDPDLTGKVLIAMPGMTDPRFQRSVVYLCSHGPQGAMGLIVNKPRPDVRFAGILENLGLSPAEGMRDIRVHIGGPVDPQRGFVLHSTDVALDEGTLVVSPDAAMTASRDILDIIARGDGPRQAVFALGYAGWGPGQLEGEIARNDWLIADGRPDLLFGRADEFKWAAALKSIGVDPQTLSGVAGRA
jgi:putative transcriptional regulator